MTDRSLLYEKLCNRADALLEQYNPCKIENGKCARGQFCCDGCLYLIENSTTGLMECSVRSLLCKTWLCSYLNGKGVSTELILGLKELFYIGRDNDLLVIRGGYEDSVLKERSLEYFKHTIVDMPWYDSYSLPCPRKN